MSVLVTGGYGLLGSWLVKALLDRGATVVVLERAQPGVSALELMGLQQRIEVVHGDICDHKLLDRTLREYGVQSVFHLAAQTLVGAARQAPVATFETNIRGTWLLLDSCRRQEIERVIVASSDKAYGHQSELPYRESQPLLASFPYEVSKAACDMLARSYWHTYGLPVAVTRFANLYGGGDMNPSRLIPEVVRAVLAGRPPVIRSDGSPERDFLYVEDAVRAYLAIWELLGRGEARGEAFNAGSGRSHRVGDVVALICTLAGTSVEPDVRGAGTPAGEIERQWVDAGKLRGLTGWEPEVPLEDGLSRTIAWYRAHPVSWRPQ